MIRLIFYICSGLVCTGYISITNAADVNYPMIFEVRIPKEVRPAQKTSVSLVAYHGESATFLSACNQREEGGFVVFRGEFLVFSEDKPQRGLIIDPLPEPVQVFRLSIPQTPKPTDWTRWQRPDYLEKGDAGWTFSFPDSKVTGRSTNIPLVCFEVRYRIEGKHAIRPDTHPAGEYRLGFVNKTGYDLSGLSVYYGDEKVSPVGNISTRSKVSYSDPLTLAIPTEAEIRWKQKDVDHAVKAKFKGLVPNNYSGGTIFFVIKDDNLVEVRPIKWGNDKESIDLVK
jgi:hypothetical protein